MTEIDVRKAMPAVKVAREEFERVAYGWPEPPAEP